MNERPRQLADGKRTSGRRGAWLHLLVWLSTCAPAFLPKASLAQSTGATEYQVKAVFLFYFTQFVEWPSEAFAEEQTRLVIGILGEDPFGAALDDIVRSEMVNNRSLVVERYRRVEDVKICHMLFISRTEAGRLQNILAGLKGRSILTIGDAEGSAHVGVMIRFVTVKNKIRLKINLEVARAANLTISSKLLRPAEIVTSGQE